MRHWDSYWLARCRLNASMSTCLTRQVGAVAVRNRRSFADGFNGNLPGARHCSDGGCDRCYTMSGVARATNLTVEALEPSAQSSGYGLNTCVCVHAETNVIAFCASEGIRTAGATLYTTTQPCMDCLKLIVSAEFIEVVYAEPYAGATYDQRDHAITFRIFEE